MEPESTLSKLRWWVCRLMVRIILALPALAAFIAAAVGGWDLAGQIVHRLLDGEWVEYSARQFLVGFDILNDEPITGLEWLLDIHPMLFFTGPALALTGLAGGIRATLPRRLTKPPVPKPHVPPPDVTGPSASPSQTNPVRASAPVSDSPAHVA